MEAFSREFQPKDPINTCLITCKMQLFSMLSSFLSVGLCVITSESSSAPPLRVIRATDDPLSSAIDKMQKLSRLITAIHIRAGINTGSLTSDDIVPELLRLGSVTPSQIINMDSAKLTSAMKAIEELPGKLTEDWSIKRIEEKLAAVNVMREIAKEITGDITKWPGKWKFEFEMNKVKTNGVDVTIPGNVISKVKSWIYLMNSVKTMKLDATDQKSINELDVFVQTLNQYSSDLLTSITTLTSTTDPKPWKYPRITSATDALSSIINVVNLGEHASKEDEKLWRLNVLNHFKNYSTTLQNLSGVSKTVTDVSSDLQTVVSVTKSRGSRVVKSPDFPGFSNGYSDMETLLVDLNDVWMSKVVDSKNMEVAIRPMKEMIRAFEQADKALDPVGDAQEKALSGYSEYFNGIQKVPKTHTDIDPSIAKYADCSGKLEFSSDPSIRPVKEFIASAEKLDEAIGNVSDDVQRLIRLLNTPDVKSALKEVKTIAQSSTDAGVLAQTVQKLTSSPTIDKLSTVLVDAEKISFDVVTDIKTAAADVHSKIGSVGVFQKSLTKFPVYLICLRYEITEQMADTIRSVVGMAKKFRGVDRKVLTDGEAAVNEFYKVYKDNLKNLTESIKSLENQSSVEADRLNLLISPEMYSKDISLATIAVTKMKKALDHQKDAEVITGGLRVISDQFDALGDAIDESDKKNLRDLMYLKWPLDQMYRQLREWRSAIRATDSTDLEDYYHLFYFALSVEGITDDLGPMSQSVDRISQKVTNQTIKLHLITISGALKNLSTLDLNFAAYHQNFTNVRDTLSVLDMFFNNYKNSFAVYPKAPIVPWGPPEAAITTITTTITTIKPYQPMGYTGGSSFGTLFTFLGVVFIVLGAMTGFVIWLKVTAPKK